MNSLTEKILIATLSALLALLGAFFMYKRQINNRRNNIKTILRIELEDIKENIEKNIEQLSSEGKNGTVQLMINKVYYTPSSYDALRSDILLLKQVQINEVNKLYRKVKEIEELREYLVNVKEKNIALNDIDSKKELSPSEGIIKKKMEIYANYFLNLDALIKEIESTIDSLD